MSSVHLRTSGRSWSEAAPAKSTPLARFARYLLPLTDLGLSVVDVGVVLAAFLLAYWLRFIVPDDLALALGLEQYTRMALAVGVATTLLLRIHGLFDHARPLPWPSRLRAVVSAVSTALVLVVAVSFFFGDQRLSRVWFALGAFCAILGLYVWRSMAPGVVTAVRDAVEPARRVLIVGANPRALEVARELSSRCQVVGVVDNGSDLFDHLALPLLGPVAQLESLVHTHGVDEIVIALPADRTQQVRSVLARGFRRPVEIKFRPDLGDLLPQQVDVHRLAGRSYLGFAAMARVGPSKRALDFVLAILALVALAPLLAATAAAIRLDSRGPVFYRQQRVGKDGRRFWILKFRSMRVDAEQLLDSLREHNEASGPLFKMREDPRVTRVGRLIRRWSIDELPQLINVVRGEMSLVGPRPPVPPEVEQYGDWELGRLRAVPGITGLWQVSGRSEVPFHDMVRLDLHYIRHWSLGLDLEILARTIPAVLSKRGAY